MKIAAQINPCIGNITGVGIYEYELIKRLNNFEDIEVVGEVFDFKNKNEYLGFLANLDVNVCSKISYEFYQKVHHYLAYNKVFPQNVHADITHFFNYIVPKRIGGKVVLTIHDLTYKLFPETMELGNLARIKHDIKQSMERADKIVAVSNTVKQEMIDLLGVPPEKIEVVYPGVEFERFNMPLPKEEMIRTRDKYNLPGGYILYLGTLEPRKNILAILGAYYDLKQRKMFSRDYDVKLVIAGKKGWMYDDIFNEVKLLELENDVIFTDYVDEDDKAAIYQHAKLFVYPSLYEGFSMSVIEAMAASVPVITSNTPAMIETVGEAAIKVKADAIADLADAMEVFVVDEETRREYIGRGIQKAKEYSWDKSVKKLVDIYRSM